jgi:nicotinate-nucleotide adenylyltransferase
MPRSPRREGRLTMNNRSAAKKNGRSGMKIAILGGSFDPPHKGHIAIANRLLKLNNFNEVWLIPCYKHPFRKNLSAPNKRFQMTKYLEKDRVKVSNLEIKDKVTNYTIDTLKLLAKKYPNDRFFLIIGTDQVENFTKWKEWREIVNNFKLIVIPRDGFKKEESELKNISKQVKKFKNIILIDRKKFPLIYTSSTLIRRRIKQGESISSLVPKKVEKYIIRHKLYK